MNETMKKIRRFPRLVGEMPQQAGEQNAQADPKILRARLEEEAVLLIESHSESRRRLGRIFNELKATMPHGEWKPYFARTFEAKVSYRTATRYMEIAAQADANSKKDRLAPMKSGVDAQIDEATKEAQADVGNPERVKSEVNPTYRLALHLDPVRRKGTIKLWSSKHRDRAEKKVIAHLDELLIKYECADKHALEDQK